MDHSFALVACCNVGAELAHTVVDKPEAVAHNVAAELVVVVVVVAAVSSPGYSWGLGRTGRQVESRFERAA